MQKIDKSKIKIILVEPQLSENIGTTARAMLNFGLDNLYIISPKQNHLSLKSLKASAGADKILNKAKIFNNLEDALAEISYVFACTVRKRDMIKPSCGPEDLVNTINSLNNKSNIGILFGREKSGLTNEHISYSDTIIQIPTNSKFSSLNLAQAVVIIASEINRSIENYSRNEMFASDSIPAKKGEIIGFFNHLERALDVSGFLRPEEKKSTMMINIRNIFSRTQLTNQDVQTLRGIITALLRWPNGYKDKKILDQTKLIADGETKNKEQTN